MKEELKSLIASNKLDEVIQFLEEKGFSCEEEKSLITEMNSVKNLMSANNQKFGEPGTEDWQELDERTGFKATEMLLSKINSLNLE